MAIMFRPVCLQISSCRFSNSQVFNAVGNTVNSRAINNKKLFWSWCSKKREKSPTTTCQAPQACKSENVLYKSSCRKLLPQCPEHIDTGDPSKCCEKGYGKPIKEKKTWFTNVKPTPRLIKQKPSNCDPPPCPKEEETFMDYIFGPEKPLPDPLTCRCAWKLKQSCNLEDPRLDDPRYQATEGDVLLYTESDRRKTQLPKGPQPLDPSPYIAPAGVICKRIRDSVAATALECYCACADPCMLRQGCDGPCLCPVHSKPFRFPYDEMKPQNRRKKFFTNKYGVASEDVMLPPRSESCTCMHSVFIDKKNNLLPEHETCDLHEALQRRGEVLKRNEFEGADKTMSKSERLRLITQAKETQIKDLKVQRKNPLPCECKCKEIVVFA